MLDSKELSFTPDISGTMGRIELAFEENGQRRMVGYLLDAHDLDNVIGNLGASRAKMVPAHQAGLDPNPVFTNVTRGAQFFVDRDTKTKEVVIAVLHPGYGWLAFPLEAKNALGVGAAIAKVAMLGQRLVGLDGKPL